MVKHIMFLIFLLRSRIYANDSHVISSYLSEFLLPRFGIEIKSHMKPMFCDKFMKHWRGGCYILTLKSI